jgi:hypothetical protein
MFPDATIAEDLISCLATGPRIPITLNYPSGSPEVEFFKSPPLTRQASRWKQDFEELELLVGLSA